MPDPLPPGSNVDAVFAVRAELGMLFPLSANVLNLGGGVRPGSSVAPYGVVGLDFPSEGGVLRRWSLRAAGGPDFVQVDLGATIPVS